jgi:hypothetical protein
LSLAAAARINATETTALGSTSEFADCIVPLPIVLLSFNATKLNEHTSLITWETISEKDNEYFLIERSIDGINFETIGKVKGAINSSSLIAYSFIDENPALGVNYYRLKQVDLDTKSSYSSIKSVDFSGARLSFRSEGGNYFILSNFGQETEIQYELISTDGKSVLTKSYNASNAKHELMLSNLSSAVYFIRISSNNEFVSDKLLVR